MIDPQTGRRYESCALCGKDWNVAKILKLPDDGVYLCPNCRAREKIRRKTK